MFIQKLDSSGVTEAYTVEGRAYAPILKNRTKIRQTRVSRGESQVLEPSQGGEDT